MPKLYMKTRALICTVCVVNNRFPALFGLPWMKEIRLNFEQLIPQVL